MHLGIKRVFREIPNSIFYQKNAKKAIFFQILGLLTGRGGHAPRHKTTFSQVKLYKKLQYQFFKSSFFSALHLHFTKNPSINFTVLRFCQKKGLYARINRGKVCT